MADPAGAAGPGSRVDVDVALLTLADPEDPDGRRRLQVWLSAGPGDGQLRLPGTPLRADADLEQAARAVLAAQGVARPRHLEQLASFGAPGRIPGVHAVSVTHLALVPAPHRTGGGGRWVDVDAVGPLAWDHGRIVDAAVQRIRSKLGYSSIAFALLPPEFTMSELQEVYEAVLGITLDKRNFRRKLGSLSLLADTGRMRRGQHRPARLYTATSDQLVLLDEVIATS